MSISIMHKPEFWAGIFTPVLAAVIILPTVLLRAWVISTLWGWYIVPAFGLAPLRLVFAFGLSIIVNAIVSHSFNGKDERSTAEKFGYLIAFPLFTLLIGWIGTFFI